MSNFLDPPMDPEPIVEDPSTGVEPIMLDEVEPIPMPVTDTSEPPPPPPPPDNPYPPPQPPTRSALDPDVHPDLQLDQRLIRLEFLVEQLLQDSGLPRALPRTYRELMRRRRD